MRAEYDSLRGLRGKHCLALQGGYRITVHKADGSVVVKEERPKPNAMLQSRMSRPISPTPRP